MKIYDVLCSNCYKLNLKNKYIITNDDTISSNRYEYSENGLYLRFEDAGCDVMRIGSLVERIKNGEIEILHDMLDEIQIDMELVDKVYKCLIKNIY